MIAAHLVLLGRLLRRQETEARLARDTLLGELIIGAESSRVRRYGGLVCWIDFLWSWNTRKKHTYTHSTATTRRITRQMKCA